jgi:hypothetical protein
MRRCLACKAELGPWEDDECRTCSGAYNAAIRDRAISVLETADQPLAWWDVKRHLDREGRWDPVRPATTSQVLADDPRACWAGKGVYGLYRHGLLPGLRDLGRAAGVYIHASDKALTVDEVRFILRHVGYRFSADSLEPALWRVSDLGIFKVSQAWQPDGTLAYVFEGRRDSEDRQRAAARAMRFSKRTPVFHAVHERTVRQVAAALKERKRRLR